MAAGGMMTKSAHPPLRKLANQRVIGTSTETGRANAGAFTMQGIGGDRIDSRRLASRITVMKAHQEIMPQLLKLSAVLAARYRALAATIPFMVLDEVTFA